MGLEKACCARFSTPDSNGQCHLTLLRNQASSDMSWPFVCLSYPCYLLYCGLPEGGGNIHFFLSPSVSCSSGRLVGNNNYLLSQIMRQFLTNLCSFVLAQILRGLP